MSARRVSEKQVPLPDNPSYLEFERSDGDERVWPTNLSRTLDSDGHVNFMQPLEIDTPMVLRWRISVGKAVAIELALPVGPAYVLKDWPQGYRMYDHHKGHPDNPRRDLYLFGSPKARFRSINEFIPHAIWLMRDPTMNNSNCLCKYCSKKTQKEVTASLPNILGSTSGTSSPSPTRLKSQRDRPKNPRETASKNQPYSQPRVYATVQRVAKPLSQVSTHVTKQPMLVERNSDLRAVYSNTTMKLKRWFRVGELLWCALDPPIQGEGEDVAIRFWPGLVDEVRLKTRPSPRATSSVNFESVMGDGAVPQVGNDTNTDNASGPVLWTVRQSTMYKMQLVGVSHTCLVDDDQVLPYQAYVLPNELIAALQVFPPEKLDFSRDSLSNFNPCAGGGPSDFADAIAPYAMAVQISSAISSFWNLTDDWAFNYTLSPPVAPEIVPTPRPAAPSSLQSAIEAASRHNFQVQASASSGPSSSQHYPDVSAPNPDMSASEVQKLSTRVVGIPPAPKTRQTQVRFQGLWWGAERIWTDEFIRLKVPRRCLAPNGAEDVYPPSGPGKSARELWMSSGRDTAELGAGARGVFMRLDGLTIVDAVQPDGITKKECRAHGMLYELADLDWEDPNALVDQNITPNELTVSQLPPTLGSNAEAGPSFQPMVSTLGPEVLPNPDPSVPVEATPAAMMAEAFSQHEAKPSLPNDQLSHPPAPPYRLPQAPEGYRFRAILPEGYESVISLSLISGRYYPRILSHPLLDSTLQKAISNPLEAGGLMESNNLWALEGLSPGFYNSVDPTQYKKSRANMIEDADKEAASQLETHKQERLREKEEENMLQDDDPQIAELSYPDPMDVDAR